MQIVTDPLELFLLRSVTSFGQRAEAGCLGVSSSSNNPPSKKEAPDIGTECFCMFLPKSEESHQSRKGKS